MCSLAVSLKIECTVANHTQTETIFFWWIWTPKICRLPSTHPKGTSLRWTASYDVFRVKIGFGVLGVGRLKNPKKKPSKHFRRTKSRFRGKETPWRIVTQVCTAADVSDVIMCANFADDRLRGLGVAGGRISGLPIDFDRRPYNTHGRPTDQNFITNF